MGIIGCGAGSDSSASKQEEANFKNRDPQAIHGPPPGVGPGGAGGGGITTGPPPGAAGPPPGTK